MLASRAKLDLVEISPNAEPPVCKLLDFGKYKYELQKKQHQSRKNQKIIELKEVKFRPNIGENDFAVKVKHILKFLEHGDKVKVSLQFRGREITHPELAAELFQRIKEKVEDHAKIDQEPKMEGRQMLMLLSSTH